jgi:hypothetical protein
VRQNPTKLDAEDQEEAVDMAGKVFMRVDAAAFKAVSSDGKSDLRQGR